jgi:hypothetical protein
MTAAEFFRRAKVFVLPAGCTTEVQHIRSQEDLLAADGFKAVQANTPARQQQMAQLPPNHLLQRTKGDKFVYFYAGPAVCNCLNIGDQAACGRYRSEVLARENRCWPPRPMRTRLGFGVSGDPNGRRILTRGSAPRALGVIPRFLAARFPAKAEVPRRATCDIMMLTASGFATFGGS